VTVGFNGPEALLAGRIAAFTGFIPDEGVQLRVSGHPITAFPLYRYGGPSYPGLVAFTTRSLIAAHPALVEGFVRATVRGYEATLADPALGLRDLLRANPTLPTALTRASLNAYLPLFARTREGNGATNRSGRSKPGDVGKLSVPKTVPFGTLQPHSVAAMSNWMLSSNLIDAGIAPARYGTNRFLPAE
jgi:putative hydroxymethylpyrimidine transport system substrate-binding protein